MSNVSTPSQERIPIGTIVVNGRQLEVTLNSEWARFFESLTIATNSNTAMVENGRNGVDGVAAMMSAGDSGDGVEFVPGPPGPNGAQGDPGLALFMLQDDSGYSEPIVPYTQPAEGTFVPLSSKDASGGVPGLTFFKLNLRNAANTFTSFLTNAATAVRTWTMPDKDGTVAMTGDITDGTSAGSFNDLSVTDATVKVLSTSANASARNFSVGQLSAFGTLNINIGSALGSDPDSGTAVVSLSATGAKVEGGFGCNGKTPQAAVAVNAACTDLPTAIALTNQIRAALIANGITV